jgi:hypothetical protein
VVDFLVGAAVRRHLLVREAMGKGNSVDESHCMEKEVTVG